jgi:hypothetical protein
VLAFGWRQHLQNTLLSRSFMTSKDDAISVPATVSTDGSAKSELLLFRAKKIMRRKSAPFFLRLSQHTLRDYL